MKSIYVMVLSALLTFTVSAQEREFSMSQLNEDMGNVVSADSDFADLPPAQRDGMGIVLLRIVGSLALVLAILAAIAWGVRKSGILGQSIPAAVAQTPSMSVLEALSTGYGGTILLVRCEEQVFLLGQTASRYTLLQELPPDASKKIIDAKAGVGTLRSFKTSLADFMRNLNVQKNVLRS